MVLRRRNSQYLHPVNTVKHVVDRQRGIIAATPDKNDIVIGNANPATGNDSEVNIGAHVKSVFLNVQVAATSTAALANIYMMIYGNPGANIADSNVPNANVVGASDFRKMVFHQEMIMTEKNTTAFPRTLFRGVIKIPRKFARIGVNDRISLQFFSPGVSYDLCFQCIYKEIR